MEKWIRTGNYYDTTTKICEHLRILHSEESKDLSDCEYIEDVEIYCILCDKIHIITLKIN